MGCVCLPACACVSVCHAPTIVISLAEQVSRYASTASVVLSMLQDKWAASASTCRGGGGGGGACVLTCPPY